jgi:hypothetical protein
MPMVLTELECTLGRREKGLIRTGHAFVEQCPGEYMEANFVQRFWARSLSRQLS